MSSDRLRQIALGVLLSLAAAAGLTLVEAVTLRIQFLSAGRLPIHSVGSRNESRPCG